MNHRSAALLTEDETVFARFRQLGGDWAVHRLSSVQAITGLPPQQILVIDSACSALPGMKDPSWRAWAARLPLIITSSAPNDEEGLRYLELGASGYCHAYASPASLQQVLEVVASGEQWVGRSLLKRLLHGLNTAHQTQTENWAQRLSERETEVARLAAAGDSNQSIASALNITERTVKAHLSACFEKLGVNDRLQLALKVHGIRG